MNVTVFVYVLFTATSLLAAPGDYFKITVVDEQTGRGVPLVELKTVHHLRHVTDSNGVVAFNEPGLMGQRVFFHVASHGYEFPADGFGYQGAALDVKPGGAATLKIKRLNIAERLYRVTGAGTYRDSVLVGAPVPIKQPVLNAQVLGQDSTLACVYQGKLFWLWGDTSRASYPLGNFSTTCATSLLPGRGGLDPAVGVDLEYFVGDDGFTKKMCPLPEPGLVWLDGLLTVPDETGRERLVARYVRLKDLGQVLEHGIAMFNDQSQVFERVQPWAPDGPIKSLGHPLRHAVDGVEYFYFPTPYPSLRVRVDLASLKDPSRYEAFTPLVAGSRFDKTNPNFERDPATGALVYGWKRYTAQVGPGEQRELEAAGLLKPDEGRWQLRDTETGKPVVAHAGSVFYNAYRKRFVMIVGEVFGRSVLGEVWYAEADDPLGPWTNAVRVVTHDKYSFYNPVHHPYFDQEGGRVIYFEGTYTTTFSGNEHPTPRYEYNQVMYRLDLSDPRLRPAQQTTRPSE
jgi:hypothetical protein